MPRGDQLSRQWRLFQLIDRPQGVTVDDAARQFGCGPRSDDFAALVVCRALLSPLSAGLLGAEVACVLDPIEHPLIRNALKLSAQMHRPPRRPCGRRRVPRGTGMSPSLTGGNQDDEPAR